MYFRNNVQVFNDTVYRLSENKLKAGQLLLLQNVSTATLWFPIQVFNPVQPCLAMIFVTDYYQCAIVKMIERSPLKLNRFTVAIEVIPKDRFNRANEM